VAQFLPFETCRLRTERAALHGKTLAELWNGFDTGSSYTTTIDFQDDGTGEIFIKPVNPDWFVQFSLEYGEALYHLRAALDSCVYDAAILHKGTIFPDEEKALMFPICASNAEFKNAARRIGPLPDQLKAFVESIQPYKAAAITNNVGVFPISDILGYLNRWSVFDRHRRLHIAGTFPTRGRIQVVPPEGMTLDDLTFVGDGILENQSKVGTCKIGNFVRGAKIKVHTQLALQIAVKDGPEFVIATNSLGSMLIVCWEVMEKFKKFFGV
jgi:hypothetical protein